MTYESEEEYQADMEAQGLHEAEMQSHLDSLKHDQEVTLAKSRAEELYGTFTQYDWNEEYGWIESESQTISIVNKVIDILIEEQTMWQNGQSEPVLFWQEVKRQLKTI